MKKKVFRERYAEKIFDMKYDEVIKSAKEVNLEKEIKAIVEEAVEEKPVKRGRKKSVKSDK